MRDGHDATGFRPATGGGRLISARRQHGFSLVELVIVVVIIGVIAAIAIPRASRGARRSGASALVMDLSVMQKAIELYAAEHGGKYPSEDVVHQLTEYSDSTGNSTNATKDTAVGIVYGPYLKKFPPLPVGSKKGAVGVFHIDDGAALPPGGMVDDGWWYNSVTQEIRANLPGADQDSDGDAYNTYTARTLKQ